MLAGVGDGVAHDVRRVNVGELVGDFAAPTTGLNEAGPGCPVFLRID